MHFKHGDTGAAVLSRCESCRPCVSIAELALYSEFASKWFTVVSSSQTSSTLVIVAKPNHSSTWRNNKLALLAIAVPSLGAALGFTALGAWPVLPFAGAELLALGSALYYVNWKLQYRHVITVSADAVRVDKGFYAPRRSWRLRRDGAAVAVAPELHPWEGPRLSLHGDDVWVPVGEFLNRDDALSLLALLRRELLVRQHSRAQRVPL